MSLNELQNENIKLRNENTNMGELLEDIWNELDAIKTENDKLRKVVKRMRDLIKDSCNVCDGCCCSSWDEDNECCIFDSYMREFKIW